MVAAAALGAAGSAAAQPADRPLPLQGFRERLDPSVQVSTVPPPLIGATTEGAAQLLSPALRLPRQALPGQPVCVETVSRDGTYWARGEVLPDWLAQRQGVLRWTYAGAADQPSAYLAELQRMGPENLAVMASLGACGAEGRAQTIAAVDRSGAAGGDAAILLYMLAPNHRVTVRYTPRGGEPQEVHCTAQRGRMPSRAFDKLCRLAGPFAAVTDLQVLQQRGDRTLETAYRLLYVVSPTPPPAAPPASR